MGIQLLNDAVKHPAKETVLVANYHTRADRGYNVGKVDMQKISTIGEM